MRPVQDLIHKILYKGTVFFHILDILAFSDPLSLHGDLIHHGRKSGLKVLFFYIAYEGKPEGIIPLPDL